MSASIEKKLPCQAGLENSDGGESAKKTEVDRSGFSGQARRASSKARFCPVA